MSAVPGQRLISGVEPNWTEGQEPVDSWRVFIGGRWSWKYILVTFEEARNIYGVWQNTPELWVTVPDSAEVFSVPREERIISAEAEKAMYYRVKGLMESADAVE